MADNIHIVKGVVYSKDTRKVPNTKKPTEPDWEFHSMKIETEINVSGRTFTTIPEFSIDKGVSFDDFAVGDSVEADFYFTGKQVSKNWYKSEAKITYMKFADIRTPPPPKATGKVNVGSMTNPSELTNPKLPPKPDVFDTPRPSQMVKQDDGEEWDQLPF